MRGEDVSIATTFSSSVETPPRAWGRRCIAVAMLVSSRNTPTCVGKTAEHNINIDLEQKHPHVRGEDAMTKLNARQKRENTPTCVGKTHRMRPAPPHRQKHPHMRGEDAL